MSAEQSWAAARMLQEELVRIGIPAGVDVRRARMLRWLSLSGESDPNLVVVELELDPVDGALHLVGRLRAQVRRRNDGTPDRDGHLLVAGDRAHRRREDPPP